MLASNGIGGATTLPFVPPASPSAPASPPPSSSPSGGGSSSPQAPLQNYVAQDPAYQQATADYNAALGAAAGSRDSATNQALIGFGAVPDFSSVGKQLGLSDAQIAAITGEVGSGTSSLADQYTRSGDSVLGQLSHAHDVALATLRAQLAARGMLESGATGVGVGNETQNYQQGLSNAYGTLLHNLLGFQDTYANAAGSARTALENAASSAYDRAVNLADKYPGMFTTPAGPPSGFGGAPPDDPSRGGESPTQYYGPHTPQAPRVPSIVNPYVTGQKRFG